MSEPAETPAPTVPGWLEIRASSELRDLVDVVRFTPGQASAYLHSGFDAQQLLWKWFLKWSAELAAVRARTPPPEGLFGYCAICYHPLDLCSHCDAQAAPLGPDKPEPMQEQPSDRPQPLRRDLARLLDNLYGLHFRPGHLDAVLDVIHLHAPVKIPLDQLGEAGARTPPPEPVCPRCHSHSGICRDANGGTPWLCVECGWEEQHGDGPEYWQRVEAGATPLQPPLTNERALVAAVDAVGVAETRLRQAEILLAAARDRVVTLAEGVAGEAGASPRGSQEPLLDGEPICLNHNGYGGPTRLCPTCSAGPRGSREP